MNARELEDQMLTRCMSVARNAWMVADNQREANIFRIAGMVVQSRFPREATNLIQTSENYFLAHPTDKLHASDVVQHGWIASLPRLRDMLSMKLQHH